MFWLLLYKYYQSVKSYIVVNLLILFVNCFNVFPGKNYKRFNILIVLSGLVQDYCTRLVDFDVLNTALINVFQSTIKRSSHFINQIVGKPVIDYDGLNN